MIVPRPISSGYIPASFNIFPSFPEPPDHSHCATVTLMAQRTYGKKKLLPTVSGSFSGFPGFPPFCAKTGASGGHFWDQDPLNLPENMFFTFGLGGG